MPRKSRILRFSVPSGLGKEFETLAKTCGKSKSELFREMMTVYRARRDEEGFVRIQHRISRQLKRPRPFTEKEIDRIVFEDR